MNGLLECGRAMRMDGKFVGDLVSSGSITVGPTGTVTGDLKGLKFLRVEGQVRAMAAVVVVAVVVVVVVVVLVVVVVVTVVMVVVICCVFVGGGDGV